MLLLVGGLDYTELTSSGLLASAIKAASISPVHAEQCLTLATTIMHRAPRDLHFELLVGQGLFSFVLAQTGDGVEHGSRLAAVKLLERVAASECRALLLTKEAAQTLQKVLCLDNRLNYPPVIFVPTPVAY